MSLLLCIAEAILGRGTLANKKGDSSTFAEIRTSFTSAKIRDSAVYCSSSSSSPLMQIWKEESEEREREWRSLIGFNFYLRKGEKHETKDASLLRPLLHFRLSIAAFSFRWCFRRRWRFGCGCQSSMRRREGRKLSGCELQGEGSVTSDTPDSEPEPHLFLAYFTWTRFHLVHQDLHNYDGETYFHCQVLAHAFATLHSEFQNHE